MSVTTRVPSCLKASLGRRIAPRKSALRGEVLAGGGVLLVEREVTGDQGEDAAGLHGVQRLCDEEIVQRQLAATVVELHVGEGRIADRRVEAILGQLRVAEILDADVGSGVEGAGDAAGDRIELDADEAHALRRGGHEAAGGAAGFEHGGVCRDAEAGQGGVHGGDDDGRGVEGVEGGFLRTGVLLGRQQRFQLLADHLPGGVLVGVLDRVGEDVQGHGSESAEAGQRLPFIGSGGALLALDLLERAYGRDDVAGPGLVAARAGDGGCRGGAVHGVVSSSGSRPRNRGLTARQGISPGPERACERSGQAGNGVGAPVPAGRDRRADYRAVLEGRGRGRGWRWIRQGGEGDGGRAEREEGLAA